MEIKDWISLSGQLLVFAGLVFTILKFSREKKREFQKRFFEEQLRTYTEAVNCTATITLYNKTDAAYTQAVMDFKRLFWGKMCIVEDKEVEAKMCAFNKLLDQYDREKDPERSSSIRGALLQAGLVLAHACRNSSLHTWEIDYQFRGFNDYTLTKQERMAQAGNEG